MERNNYQKIIARVLGTRPIAFNPDLAKALGSAKAGLFLSQLLFWWEKGIKPNWIYKTIEEIKEETSLSREEQDSAIKICKKYGVLEVKLMGIPAKRHFKVNIPKIIKLLESSLRVSRKQDCVKSTNLVAGNPQTNTNNTAEITNIDSSLYKRSKNEVFTRLSSPKEIIDAYKKGGRNYKPFFWENEMRWSQNKWWVIKDGEWLEFTEQESKIEWK